MARRGRPPHRGLLTPREQQVLDLLAEGLSNPQIARRLDISRDGVKYHVSEILSKLGVGSREEAAQWLAAGAPKPWWQRLPGFAGIPRTAAQFLRRSIVWTALAAGALGFAAFAAAVLLSRGGMGGAQTAVVTTLAGSPETANHTPSYVDGPGTSARFDKPVAVAVDSAGNVYVADSGNNRLRKILPFGDVSTIDGPGEIVVPPRAPGSPPLPGPAGGTTGLFYVPQALAADAQGNVYLSGLSEAVIYRITPAGVVTAIAGNPTPPPRTAPFTEGPYGDYKDQPLLGAAGQAIVMGTTGIAADQAGNVYIVGDLPNVVSGRNQMVRKITPDGQVVLVAGSEEAGFRDGNGADARFSRPYDIAIDPDGDLFVVDRDNARIRKITPDGAVSTLAGSGEKGFLDGPALQARFRDPVSVAAGPDGTLYVLDSGAIRAITTGGMVATIAGTGNGVLPIEPGSVDGPAYDASFSNPSDIAVDKQGAIYVADTENNTIRKVSFRPAGSVAPAPVAPRDRVQANAGEDVSVLVYADAGVSAGAPCIDMLGEIVAVTVWDALPNKLTTCNTGDFSLGYAYEFLQGQDGLYLSGAKIVLKTTLSLPELHALADPSVPDTVPSCRKFEDRLLAANADPGNTRAVECLVQPLVPGSADPAISTRAFVGERNLPPDIPADVRCWQLARYQLPGTEGSAADLPCIYP